MTPRGLSGFALLFLAFSISAHAQSLGDIARQNRAERQRNGTPNLKVYTNDDISSPARAERAESETAAPDADKKEVDNPDASKTATKDATQPAKSADSTGKDESQKSETDLRTEEINQRYLDRIKEIRTKLDAAQKEVTKLKQEQTESFLAYQRSLNTFPNPEVFENEQRSMREQIQSQSDLIVSLSSQLEDAQEAARHAGVPHATD